jgi:glutathionyl-hydroquinone reductase
MGQLVDGIWSTEWYDTAKSGGRFVRSTAGFRNWVTADGSAGPSGERRLQGRERGATTSTSPTPAPGRTAR